MVDDTKSDLPLVVDLDGTLLSSDILLESYCALLATDLQKAFGAVIQLVNGKAAFKAYIAAHAPLEVALLPYNSNVITHLVYEHSRGRRIFLASASDARYVEAVSNHFGFFEGHFGSNGIVNLSGKAKAEKLTERFGAKGFDYVGNDWADIEVWNVSRVALYTGTPRRLAAQLRKSPGAIEINAPPLRIRNYLRALRPHQWVKNILVFVPLLASHSFTVSAFIIAALAWVSFSLAASSAYVLNDLLDLSNDRDHSTKKLRPIACGAVPLRHAATIFPLLLAGAVGTALAVSPAFLGILCIYYATTLAYSFFLKRKLLIDTFVLAGLYTIRVLAGTVALDLTLSGWLLIFSIFVFLCLALVKRYIELIGRLRRQAGDPRGRDYLIDDLPMLSAMGAASGCASVVVLALYFQSPEVHILYRHPENLWLICPVVLYWIYRILILAHRGTLHEDPVVFAITDRTSQGTLLLLALIIALAF